MPTTDPLTDRDRILILAGEVERLERELAEARAEVLRLTKALLDAEQEET